MPLRQYYSVNRALKINYLYIYMTTRRKDMRTPRNLYTIHEYGPDNEIVRLEQEREKERRREEAILSARQQHEEEEIEKMREREQEAERSIAELEERRRLAEKNMNNRSKGWFSWMGPFSGCAMGVTRKRKLNSKKKPKPNSRKKRKPRATTNKRRNTRRNTRNGR